MPPGGCNNLPLFGSPPAGAWPLQRPGFPPPRRHRAGPVLRSSGHRRPTGWGRRGTVRIRKQPNPPPQQRARPSAAASFAADKPPSQVQGSPRGQGTEAPGAFLQGFTAPAPLQREETPVGGPAPPITAAALRQTLSPGEGCPTHPPATSRRRRRSAVRREDSEDGTGRPDPLPPERPSRRRGAPAPPAAHRPEPRGALRPPERSGPWGSRRCQLPPALQRLAPRRAQQQPADTTPCGAAASRAEGRSGESQRPLPRPPGARGCVSAGRREEPLIKEVGVAVGAAERHHWPARGVMSPI